MIRQIKAALTRSLYRQLVLVTTLLLTLALTLFGWEMLRRQFDLQAKQQQEQLGALASSLATSSATWVSSRDLSGLQEIVAGVGNYPSLRYAMVVEPSGLILAHIDSSRRGQYLTDLPAQPVTRVLLMADNVVDVSQPVTIGQHHIGWVRVGVGNDSFYTEFAKAKRDIVLFTIFSIVLASLIAALAARYQTRRLRRVENVARAVALGQRQLRAEVWGVDEAAQLAQHFNAMLDQLDDRERALQRSQALLEQSQQLGKIGGWEWDVVKSSMYWTTETFHIHDMPVEVLTDKGRAAIDQSAACYPEPDRTRVLQAFWLCVGQGIGYDIECPFVTVKQRYLWIRTQGQAELQDGKVVKVKGYIADITERKRMEMEIRNLAYFDPLTGLPNRRMVSDRMQSAMARAQRNASYGALIYLDLDNFKPLNDAHGHAAGDLLLMEVAKRLKQCVRQVDTVGRTGGDEFVVILNGLSTELDAAIQEGQQIAQKVLLALSMPYVLATAAGQPDAALIEHHCTASLGVALFRGTQVTMADVMEKADAAMYAAKEAGRNCIQFDAV
ncbi:MAG: diguanylate cyclase [Rhodoferax sp.]|nr:diguanylate cyclase [Rhodoferax sp.]